MSMAGQKGRWNEETWSAGRPLLLVLCSGLRGGSFCRPVLLILLQILAEITPLFPSFEFPSLSFLILSACPRTLEILAIIIFLKTNNESFVCSFNKYLEIIYYKWSQNSRLTFKGIKRNRGCHLELAI